MTLKTIDDRLQNWSKWCRTWGASGGSGASSMTAVVCNRAKRAAQGDLTGGANPRDDLGVEAQDALLIERGMWELDTFNRLLLRWCYIEMVAPEVVCRKMSIPVRPASEFITKFRAAQDAIENQVGKLK